MNQVATDPACDDVREGRRTERIAEVALYPELSKAIIAVEGDHLLVVKEAAFPQSPVKLLVRVSKLELLEEAAKLVGCQSPIPVSVECEKLREDLAPLHLQWHRHHTAATRFPHRALQSVLDERVHLASSQETQHHTVQFGTDALRYLSPARYYVPGRVVPQMLRTVVGFIWGLGFRV